MWKQRRVSRSERGFVVAQVGLDGKSSDAVTPVKQLAYELSVLEKAQNEIATTRTLSPATYADVLVALELVRTGVLKPRWWGSRMTAVRTDYEAVRAIPGEAEMDQILRYDRALQKLLESQQRRRKAQVRVSV
jgi:hypothetical protein